MVETCEALKQRFAAAVSASNGLQDALRRALSLINGMAGVAESFDTLHRVLEMQSYRLAFWRVAASDINYRRFFDINALSNFVTKPMEVLGFDPHDDVVDWLLQLVSERKAAA